MTYMTHQDMNYQASYGTAENLRKLLKAYGHSSKAVRAMQDGVDGYAFGYDVDGYRYIYRKKGAVREAEEKATLMADFRAREGVFAPKTSFAAEIRGMAELTARVNRIEEKLGIAPISSLAPVQDQSAAILQFRETQEELTKRLARVEEKLDAATSPGQPSVQKPPSV